MSREQEEARNRKLNLIIVIAHALAKRGLSYNPKHPDYSGSDYKEHTRNAQFILSDDMEYKMDHDLSTDLGRKNAVAEWIEDTLEGEPKYFKRSK